MVVGSNLHSGHEQKFCMEIILQPDWFSHTFNGVVIPFVNFSVMTSYLRPSVFNATVMTSYLKPSVFNATSSQRIAGFDGLQFICSGGSLFTSVSILKTGEILFGRGFVKIISGPESGVVEGRLYKAKGCSGE